MSESLKGFCTVLLRNPSRIRVKWDRITPLGFEGIQIAWWCIGDPVVYDARLLPGRNQYSHIPVKLGETYVVAARAHFRVSPINGVAGYYSTEWAHTVVEMPQEDKPQYTDLGQVTVIDTPRGPAILLDELWEARG